MEKDINAGGIKSVGSSWNAGNDCAMIALYVHHQLDDEEIREFMAILERLAVELVAKVVEA